MFLMLQDNEKLEIRGWKLEIRGRKAEGET
jgi:hypothetical protein